MIRPQKVEKPGRKLRIGRFSSSRTQLLPFVNPARFSMRNAMLDSTQFCDHKVAVRHHNIGKNATQ
jgi:hypothetical protein